MPDLVLYGWVIPGEAPTVVYTLKATGEEAELTLVTSSDHTRLGAGGAPIPFFDRKAVFAGVLGAFVCRG